MHFLLGNRPANPGLQERDPRQGRLHHGRIPKTPSILHAGTARDGSKGHVARLCESIDKGS